MCAAWMGSIPVGLLARREHTHNSFPRVKVDTNITPNLIMHVMACGGVAGSREYGRRHEDTIDPREMALLKSLTTHF